MPPLGKYFALIPQETRQRMRQCWVEHRTVSKVAAICGVSWDTANKYKRVDKWDDVAAEHDAAIIRAEIGEAVKARKRLRDLALGRIELLARGLSEEMKRVAEGKSKAPEWDTVEYDRLARLVVMLYAQTNEDADDADRYSPREIRTKADVRRALRDLSDGDIGNPEDNALAGIGSAQLESSAGPNSGEGAPAAEQDGT